MLISLKWIKRYVALTQEPETISIALTSLGFEVESLKLKGFGLKNVVVGEVTHCEKHPNADKLRVCKVFDGQITLPVVCGAPNVAKGQKVLLAQVGAVLPNGLEIKAAKIRGEESQGMLCAEDELGLGDSHAGILELPENSIPGTPLENLEEICDALFEISVTPNRPDALCHIGIARELAARFKLPLNLPTGLASETKLEKFESAGNDIVSGQVSRITVEAPDACKKYLGQLIKGIKVGPSPKWLIDALASIGQRSINNVVDVTNYALLECNHPSHAFDYAKLTDSRIVVRYAKKGETLTTLDHIERQLDSRDLVICDAQKPLCLAGVMGGIGSEVDETTKDVFLEVAYFDPGIIRKQARRHGLSTDSSYRFERGIDPSIQIAFCKYLTSLIISVAGGEAIGRPSVFTESGFSGDTLDISLRKSRIQRVLGISLSDDTIQELLQDIGFECVEKKEEVFLFRVPGFRPDVSREIDLIEEIARLNDYNKIPVRMPILPMSFQERPAMENLFTSIRSYLCSQGLDEAMSLRFMSHKNLSKLNLKNEDERNRLVDLRNPLNEELESLPSSLLPSLLNALAFNQRNQEKDCRFFELGKSFISRHESRNDREPGVEEREILTLLFSGQINISTWENPEAIDFFYVKGILEGLFKALGYGLRFSAAAQEPFLHPKESVQIFSGESLLGVMGLLHPSVTKDFQVRGSVYVAELRLDKLLQCSMRTFQAHAIASHFGISRDINILVEESMPYETVYAKLTKENLPYISGIRLVNLHRGTGLPEGKKSLLFNLSYQNPEKSLTDEEVNGIQEDLRQRLIQDPELMLR